MRRYYRRHFIEQNDTKDARSRATGELGCQLARTGHHGPVWNQASLLLT
jgi:hypothetical protein